MMLEKSHNNIPISIQSILDSLIEKDATPDISTISSLWFKVVSNEEAKQTRPIATKNSILLVHVSGSVWMQELILRKKYILNKLNNLERESFITDIKFKIGNI